MTPFKRLSLAEKAIELLDHERAVLIDGNAKALRGLYPRKEKLFEDLMDQGSKMSADDMERIQSKTAENAQLYRAVLSGYANVSERLTEISGAKENLNTYTASGQPQKLRSRSSQMERKS